MYLLTCVPIVELFFGYHMMYSEADVPLINTAILYPVLASSLTFILRSLTIHTPAGFAAFICLLWQTERRLAMLP